MTSARVALLGLAGIGIQRGDLDAAEAKLGRVGALSDIDAWLAAHDQPIER